jgi:hypothetical protein
MFYQYLDTMSNVRVQESYSFETDGYIYTALKMNPVKMVIFGAVVSVPLNHYMDYICLN